MTAEQLENINMKLDEKKRVLWNSLTEEEQNALRILTKLPKRTKWDIATMALMDTPEGIANPSCFYQPFDHRELRGLPCEGMNIDWFMELRDTTIGESVPIAIEYKRRYIDFDAFNGTKECRLLEKIVNSNTKSKSIAIFAVHDVSRERAVSIEDLVVKNIYMKRNVEDEIGSWHAAPAGTMLSDYLVSLCKDAEYILARRNAGE